MNTLSDTDEGRARPSAWPVYVMSGIIGLFSLSYISWVWFVPMMAQGYAEYPQHFQQVSPGAHEFARLMQRLVPYALLFGVYGVFGVVTVIGAALFRPWAWWCAVAWLAGNFLWQVFLVANIGVTEVSSPAGLITLAFYGLIIWPLATRRRSFFPAKPAGEE